MNGDSESPRRLDGVVLLLLFALLLLLEPVRGWWASPDSPWYVPYLGWLLLVLLMALARRRGGDDL